MGSSRPAQTVGSVPLQNAFVNLLDFNFFKAREIRNNIFQILITAKNKHQMKFAHAGCLHE